jgi:hypothetical protein
MADIPNKSYPFQGIRCFDPRVNDFILTGNPALVIGDLLNRGMVYAEGIDASYDNLEFWEDIKVFADYFDEKITKS